MKGLAKRLHLLGGKRESQFDHWSDEQIIGRINDIGSQLQTSGFDLPVLDGGTGDLDRLRVTEKMITQSIG